MLYLGDSCGFLEAYPRKSVVFFDFNPRKSVVFIGFYPRKSVSLQCKLLNVRLL